MAEILELYATGQMEHSEDTAAKTMATQRVAELAVDIAKLTSKATVGSPPVGQTIREAWETHDLEWRRRLLDLLIEKVIVRPIPKTPGYAPPRFGQWKFDRARSKCAGKPKTTLVSSGQH